MQRAGVSPVRTLLLCATAAALFVGSNAALPQKLRYMKYCLNNLAPRALRIAVPPAEQAFCRTYTANAATRVSAAQLQATARRPQPSLRDSLNAEILGEENMRRFSRANNAAHLVALIEARATARSAAKNPGNLNIKWPTTSIPYCFGPGLSDQAIINFNWGANHVTDVTKCITFRLVECNATEANLIKVLKDATRCSSELGFKNQPVQTISWGDNCRAGSGAHELLHALGFDHMMTRLDRDKYLEVNLTNIKDNKQHNFKQQAAPFADYGAYDYKSILHYPAKSAFNVDPNAPALKEKSPRAADTPPPLNSPWAGDAQRDSLTNGDAEAVRKMYGCAAPAPAPTPAPAPPVAPVAPVPPVSLPISPPPAVPGAPVPNPAPPAGNECFYNQNDRSKLYIMGVGDCARSTILSCSASGDCKPSPSCSGSCICSASTSYLSINTCLCVKELSADDSKSCDQGKIKAFR